uniref:Uncharacterized protein n=1 Tax=Romanomermis culicivorax TaxID=13658 RepID=A0A915JME1_ROMCU
MPISCAFLIKPSINSLQKQQSGFKFHIAVQTNDYETFNNSWIKQAGSSQLPAALVHFISRIRISGATADSLMMILLTFGSAVNFFNSTFWLGKTQHFSIGKKCLCSSRTQETVLSKRCSMKKGDFLPEIMKSERLNSKTPALKFLGPTILRRQSPVTYIRSNYTMFRRTLCYTT